MQYRGGKSRLARQILPFMPDVEYFVEPFVGGGGMTRFAVQSGKFSKFLCSDINEYVIAYFNAIKSGWMPKERYTREEFLEMKRHQKEGNFDTYSKAEMCTVGYSCAFLSKFFTTFCDAPNAGTYPMIGARKDALWAPQCDFSVCSYDSITLPEKPCVVYLDPPYKGVQGYPSGKFDHDKFYRWAEKISENHYVFVSEENMPEGWKVLWQRELKADGGIARSRTEKLFIYND